LFHVLLVFAPLISIFFFTHKNKKRKAPMHAASGLRFFSEPMA